MKSIKLAICMLIFSIHGKIANGQADLGKNTISLSAIQIQNNRFAFYFTLDNVFNYSIGYERMLMKNFGISLNGALKYGRMKQVGIDAGNYGDQVQSNLKIGLIKYFRLGQHFRIVTKLQWFREETVVDSGWRYDTTFAPPCDNKNDWYLNSLYKGIEFGYGLDYFFKNGIGIYILSSMQYGKYTESSFYYDYTLNRGINFPIVEEIGAKFIF